MNYDKSNKRSKPVRKFSELGNDIYNPFFRNKGISILEKSDDKLDLLIAQTEAFVEEKGKQLSASQLRNIYDKILRAGNVSQLKMIRPQLAYLAGRASGGEKDDIRTILSFIDNLIKETTEGTLENFKEFMEMVVAYHKFYGKN